MKTEIKDKYDVIANNEVEIRKHPETEEYAIKKLDNWALSIVDANVEVKIKGEKKILNNWVSLTGLLNRRLVRTSVVVSAKEPYLVKTAKGFYELLRRSTLDRSGVCLNGFENGWESSIYEYIEGKNGNVEVLDKGKDDIKGFDSILENRTYDFKIESKEELEEDLVDKDNSNLLPHNQELTRKEIHNKMIEDLRKVEKEYSNKTEPVELKAEKDEVDVDELTNKHTDELDKGKKEDYRAKSTILSIFSNERTELKKLKPVKPKKQLKSLMAALPLKVVFTPENDKDESGLDFAKSGDELEELDKSVSIGDKSSIANCSNTHQSLNGSNQNIMADSFINKSQSKIDECNNRFISNSKSKVDESNHSLGVSNIKEDNSLVEMKKKSLVGEDNCSSLVALSKEITAKVLAQEEQVVDETVKKTSSLCSGGTEEIVLNPKKPKFAKSSSFSLTKEKTYVRSSEMGSGINSTFNSDLSINNNSSFKSEEIQEDDEYKNIVFRKRDKPLNFDVTIKQSFSSPEKNSSSFVSKKKVSIQLPSKTVNIRRSSSLVRSNGYILEEGDGNNELEFSVKKKGIEEKIKQQATSLKKIKKKKRAKTMIYRK